MPLWTAVNLAHYTLVPVEGMPVIHEYSRSMFRAEMFWDDVRPSFYWQSHFADQMAATQSDKLAEMVRDMMKEWGSPGFQASHRYYGQQWISGHNAGRH